MKQKILDAIVAFIILTGLVGLFLNSLPEARAEDMPPAVMGQIENNVYLIDAPSHTGTGYWITNTLMITNCHVATMNRELFIMATSALHNQSYRMDMVLCDEDKDLAILESRHPNPDVIPAGLSRGPAKLGQEVFSAGYGLGQPLSIKRGIVNLLTLNGRSLTIPIISGDSGSPVFDKHGGLIGVIVAAMAFEGPRGLSVPLANKSFYVPYPALRSFLTGLLVRIERSKGGS